MISKVCYGLTSGEFRSAFKDDHKDLKILVEHVIRDIEGLKQGKTCTPFSWQADTIQKMNVDFSKFQCKAVDYMRAAMKHIHTSSPVYELFQAYFTELDRESCL